MMARELEEGEAWPCTQSTSPSYVKGITFYSEYEISLPIHVAETRRSVTFDPEQGARENQHREFHPPASGYVYKIDLNIKPGFNNIAWCSDSPIQYVEGASHTNFPTLYFPRKDYQGGTYELVIDESSHCSTYKKINLSYPMVYEMSPSSSSPPPFLTTLIPQGKTPSLRFLSHVSSGDSLFKSGASKHSFPLAYRHNNIYLWAQVAL